MNNTTANIYFLATNLLYRSTPRACHTSSKARKSTEPITQIQ